MRHIDIATTHNITIRYELASILQRGLSTVLDFIFILIIGGVIGYIFSLIFGSTVGFTIGYLLAGFYHLLCEIYNFGQSPGKKLINIRVVNLKGTNPTIYEAFQRWIFRLIDITLSFGTLSFLFAFSSDRLQRLGDLFAGTVVIKSIPEQIIPLEKVIKIDAREREIQYPEVINLAEQEVVLIKDILDRHRKDKNENSRKAVLLLSHKVAQNIGVNIKGLNKETFLKNIIKDYVSMSR